MPWLHVAFDWARARTASLIFAMIGLCAAALTMRQSYHFGHSLGVTDAGKESYAQWLTLTDVATAMLPIATVVLWRMGAKKSGFVIGIVTALFTAFTISNQVGFGAAERLGQSAKISAVNKAYADAKAEEKRLRDGTLSWLKGMVVNNRIAKSSRIESIAATERLIASAGTFDPQKVHVTPTDIQASSLAILVKRWTAWDVTTEGVALFLVVCVSVLGTLIKPIFIGLAAFFYNRRPPIANVQKDAGQKTTAEKLQRDAGVPLAPNASARTAEVPATSENHAPQHAPTADKPQVAPIPDGRDLSAPLLCDDNTGEASSIEARGSEKTTPVPSLRSFFVGEKGDGRVIPFKARDTRKHARLSDGHVEEFVQTLVGTSHHGDSLPFRATVWEKYKSFCADHNLRPMHDKALSNALSRFGIVRHRPTGGSVYLKLPQDLEARVSASREFFATENAEAASLAH